MRKAAATRESRGVASVTRYRYSVSTTRPKPCGFQNSSTGLDLGFYAARSYSLRRPPRTGRRLIRCWEMLATGWSGPGGCSWRLGGGRGLGPAAGWFLAEGPVRPVGVVVVDVFDEGVVEVSPAGDEDAVGALAPGAGDPPLADGVRARCPGRSG